MRNTSQIHQVREQLQEYFRSSTETYLTSLQICRHLKEDYRCEIRDYSKGTIMVFIPPSHMQSRSGQEEECTPPVPATA